MYVNLQKMKGERRLNYNLSIVLWLKVFRSYLATLSDWTKVSFKHKIEDDLLIQLQAQIQQNLAKRMKLSCKILASKILLQNQSSIAEPALELQSRATSSVGVMSSFQQSRHKKQFRRKADKKIEQHRICCQRKDSLGIRNRVFH